MATPLHFNQTSPLALPMPLLLAAPLFGLAALVLFAIASPIELASRWEPALIAAVHLFTLGFLGSVMLGAVLQILPVLSGHPPLRQRLLIRVLQSSLLGGVTLLAAGLALAIPLMLQLAVGLLLLAVLLFLASAARQFRGRGWRSSMPGIAAALLGFLVAALFGLRLLAGWGFDSIDLPRQWTDIHAGWAMLAWIAPLVFAISIEVVPMFQYTRPLPRLSRLLPLLPFIGMLLATLPLTRVAGIILLAACMCSFAITILYRQATRPFGRPDTTYRLFRLGMIALLVASLVFTASLFGNTGEQWRIAATWLFLAGFAGSCVLGMLLKIVPFLVRLHLQKELWNAGQTARTLPPFQQMLPAFVDNWACRGQLLAILLATAGLAADIRWLTLAGIAAAIIAIGSVGSAIWLVVINAWRIQREMHESGEETGLA